METASYILPLNEAGLADIDKVGGKNASLGQMHQNLELLGINIPFGFIITAEAYYTFIEYNRLDKLIAGLIAKLNLICKLGIFEYHDERILENPNLLVTHHLKLASSPYWPGQYSV